MIKYIGSKRVLVPVIVDVVRSLVPAGTVIDLFSGTSRVGHGLKRAGYRVVANDLNAYAATLARCYIETDLDEIEDEAPALIDKLNSLPGEPGYVTRTFCEEAWFFQPKNGARIDAIRDWIATADLAPALEAVALVALMEAADRVDSTTGVQMAYLKQWAPRAHNDLELRVPDVLPQAPSGKGEAHQGDAVAAAKTLTGHVAYLDPPYNQHKYVGNYHVWETLVRWDAPEAYGVARKRVDVRDRKSPFNAKRKIHDALAEIVDTIDVDHLVVSFSNEGHIAHDAMVELLSRRGEVSVLTNDHKRYVGAQIGIHNPAGVKVGTVSHLENKEHLFVVSGQSTRSRRPPPPIT